MYQRHIEQLLKKVAKKYPVVTIIGPRQSGKSTLSRLAFPRFTYVSMEEPDRRREALEDPRGFFERFQGPLIIDEIQRAPDLLSYIQSLVDEPKSRRQFVLTGSHQLLLLEKVSQTLAGRSFISKLLPLSRRELLGLPITGVKGGSKQITRMKLNDFMWAGGYPRIYHKKLNARQWLEQYFQTYVERDVRSLLQVSQIDSFERFIQLCAGRVGQLLNLSSLANDCGISQPTARAWLGILQTSFICFTLQPHHRNFNKRIIKAPKLYFYDTGLLCYLLKILHVDMLTDHPLRGYIFENWVITEKVKSYYNQGIDPPFYFWRDVKGHEVDLLEDRGTLLYPTEIKASSTFHSDFVKGLTYVNSLQKSRPTSGECIYTGKESFTFKGFQIIRWSDI